MINNVDLDNELLEMTNFTKKTTGIDDVVIWIGPNPPNHGKRIKVSNSFDTYDTFTITIPDLQIIGDVNTKFIKPMVLDKIYRFLEKNIQIISDYSDRKISTEDLIEGIKKV
jgi:hypothetical protein